jgi:hypothetical protein
MSNPHRPEGLGGSPRGAPWGANGIGKEGSLPTSVEGPHRRFAGGAKRRRAREAQESIERATPETVAYDNGLQAGARPRGRASQGSQRRGGRKAR